MALRYYDDAVAAKLERWIPEKSKLRVLKPEETKRLFEIMAEDSGDQPIELPVIALSRSNDIELLSNIKQNRSFDGLKLVGNEKSTLHLNVIPVQVSYQLDIYTKTYEEGDEYLRNFLFKLINNPKIVIDIPYNKSTLRHTANIRVLSNVSDTSSISERLFTGQFTRWTIQLEIHDAFLFSIPYRPNWRIINVDVAYDDMQLVLDGVSTTVKEKVSQIYDDEKSS